MGRDKLAGFHSQVEKSCPKRIFEWRLAFIPSPKAFLTRMRVSSPGFCVRSRGLSDSGMDGDDEVGAFAFHRRQADGEKWRNCMPQRKQSMRIKSVNQSRRTQHFYPAINPPRRERLR
jgi:hypothetical protein